MRFVAVRFALRRVVTRSAARHAVKTALLATGFLPALFTGCAGRTRFIVTAATAVVIRVFMDSLLSVCGIAPPHETSPSGDQAGVRVLRAGIARRRGTLAGGRRPRRASSH